MQRFNMLRLSYQVLRTHQGARLIAAAEPFLTIRMLSTNKSGTGSNWKTKNVNSKPPSESKPPDNFYDEDVESDKEFLDISSVIMTDKSLVALTRVKDPLSWEQIEQIQNESNSDIKSVVYEANETTLSTSPATMEMRRLNEAMIDSPAGQFVRDVVSHPDLGDHLENFRDMYIPEEYINYTIPWKSESGIEDPLLEKFVPNTAPERFNYTNQGERACAGKLQRRGKEGKLNCHIIDLDELSPLDVVNLKRFLSDDAEIMGRVHTGLCSKCQRKVSKAIKTSRQLGLLPHIGQFMVEDSRPSHVDSPFHDVIKKAKRVTSKTVF